jgi:hypothetical protein
MRYNGLNILAIVVAAIAIYLIEFVIFGLLISPEQYQIMSGMSADQQNATMMARMPFGPVMPILAAIGIALVIKWRAAIGMGGGAMTGALMAVLFAFAGRMYGYVYGADTETYLLIDLGRFVLSYGVAGAIIGAWK